MVWTDLSLYLNGAMSKNALHLFAHQNRHGAHDLLGLGKNVVIDKVDEIIETSTNPSDGNISILAGPYLSASFKGSSVFFLLYIKIFVHHALKPN